MFLEWWMIITLGVFWFVSILSHGLKTHEEGATTILAGLQERGYIHIDNDGNIIGLCNQDQKEWRNSTQSHNNNKEEEQE